MVAEQLRACISSDDVVPLWMKVSDDATTLWKPIALTYVDYPEGDLVGKLLAWSSLLPIFIVVAFVTLILFRRELHTIAFFCGILLNELLNQVLKHTFKLPRPCRPGEQIQDAFHIVYGMPSSHAQFMAFFAIYMVFFSYVRLKVQGSCNWMDSFRQHFVAFSATAAALIVAFSRIYLYYHTVYQVLMGMVIGCVAGSLWFAVVQHIFTPVFPDIVNTRFAELFLIKDSTTIPNVLWFEYASSRLESRQRQRRALSKSQ